MTCEMDWIDIGENIAAIADIVSRNGINYDAIVAIGRGGMIPAAMLAHALDVPRTEYVNYSRKNGMSGHSFNIDTLGTALFIDDCTETGGTFSFIKDMYPNTEFHRAVMFAPANADIDVHIIGERYYGPCPKMPWEE